MRLFHIVLVLTLVGLQIDIFAKERKKEDIASIYDDFVVRGQNLVQKRKPSLRSSAFSTYPFVLWDYAEDIQSTSPNSGSVHWSNLLQFISENTITRVITNIKNPSAFPFFSVGQKTNSFISYAKELPSSCELAVLFDLSDFILNETSLTPVPSALPSPYPALPSYFKQLPEKMDWVRQMIVLGVNIKEVVLDPQPAKEHGTVGDYQLLIDFMDYFCTVNNLDVRLAVTYGISERTPTYANLDVFPTDSGLVPLPDNFPPLTKGLLAPEWRPHSIEPLLDHVYIQAYEPDMPYIFTLPTNPTLAGASLLHNFRDEPYVQGIGTISFSSASTEVAGTGTSFLKGDLKTGLLAVTEDMPIGVMQGGNILLVGIVSESVPITATTLSVNSPPPISGDNLPFYQTEIINKWVFPFTNPTVAGKIYIMFSFENFKNNQDPFFGTWSTDQFMAFLNSFYTQGQTSFPIYMQSEDVSIPLPNNFAIYDFNIFNQNMQ